MGFASWCIIFLQKLALYTAGICHDIDHRGYNNAFMISSKTALGSLYSSSTMEWHHFKQGVFLLEVRRRTFQDKRHISVALNLM